MSPSLDRHLAFGVLAVLGLFLFVAAGRQDLNFDASYNLLSWQNLAAGKGFVYDYGSRRIPFDPVISTGPELYLPAYLLWIVAGDTSYWTAAYVLAGYYLVFFAFLLLVVFKDEPYRFPAMLLFTLVFFCLDVFLVRGFFIHPLGEPVSVMFILAGTYLLVVRRSYLLAFLIIGFGLGVKTNTIIAVLPVLVLVFLIEHVKPAVAGGRAARRELMRTAAVFIVGSVVMLSPHLLYTKVLPTLTLSDQDEAVWEKASKKRQRHLVNHGLGQLRDATKPHRGGWPRYRERLAKKVQVAKTYLAGSAWTAIGYFILMFVVAGIAYRRRHFSFYLVAFSTAIYAWWIFAVEFPWYRYWSTGDLMFILALTTLAPTLFRQWRSWSVALVFLLVLAVFVPRFSSTDIKRVLDPAGKQHALAMAERLADIDGKQVFTWGWFQAPQFMLLTGKRFQDLLDRPQLKMALEGTEPVYFLSTREIPRRRDGKPKLEQLSHYLVPVATYGANRLYRIKNDKRVLELEF